MVSKIRIVLVETSHPGNIGAVARAMKTMGLADLWLVNPRYFPHPEATALAAGAGDVVEHAHVVLSLAEALAPCQLIFGLTARTRTLEWPLLTPRAAATKVVSEGGAMDVAFVFGREQSGLNNDELARCHYAVNIPANPVYSSLNIAAAVQIVCYELFNCTSVKDRKADTELETRFIAAADMEGFYKHCAAAMRHVGFFNAGNPDVVMLRLRRLFSRTRLDENEHNIWRGFFRAVLAMSQTKPANNEGEVKVD